LLKIATERASKSQRERESERERCHGRGWGVDLRRGFSGRKIGGGGFIKTVEEETRRKTGLE
jgi:hypothetical protein